MIQHIIPILQSSNLERTLNFYQSLWHDGPVSPDRYGRRHTLKTMQYPDYLLLGFGGTELHFALNPAVNSKNNSGMIYMRTDNIENWYQHCEMMNCVHPNGGLADMPWGQREFTFVDPDGNLGRVTETSVELTKKQLVPL